MSKKIVAMLMAVAMAFSLLPVRVLAEEKVFDLQRLQCGDEGHRLHALFRVELDDSVCWQRRLIVFGWSNYDDGWDGNSRQCSRNLFWHQ